MAPGPFNYIYGGAGEAATMEANRLAFRQWKIIPRVLRPTVPRDLSVELFGKKYRGCLPRYKTCLEKKNILCSLKAVVELAETITRATSLSEVIL